MKSFIIFISRNELLRRKEQLGVLRRYIGKTNVVGKEKNQRALGKLRLACGAI
jgi:hypothetical protein